MKFKIFSVMALLLLSAGLMAQDLGSLRSAVKMRSLVFDDDRFPDSVLDRFINEEQENIAVMGSAIARETTYALTFGVYSYPLPEDVYLIDAVILNANPDSSSEQSTPKALTFVPRKSYGNSSAYETGRPNQWSQFPDSLWLNRSGMDDRDTISVYYFAHAADMADTTDSMTVDQQYESLLIDRVVLKCYDRILLTGPTRDQVAKDIATYEAKFFGRPEDEH